MAIHYGSGSIKKLSMSACMELHDSIRQDHKDHEADVKVTKKFVPRHKTYTSSLYIKCLHQTNASFGLTDKEYNNTFYPNEPTLKF